MKKIVLIAILLPSAAFANPYLGFEYGVGSVEHDYQPVVKDRVLKPKIDEGIIGGFVGYKFNEHWALELGYREYEVDDSIEVESFDSQYEYEEDWDAKASAKQLSIMPIYTVYSNQNWKLNVGAGVSYTMYDSHASYTKTRERHFIGNEEVIEYQGKSDDNNLWGGVVSTSLNYFVTPQISLGTEVKYQIDDYASLASLSFKMAYEF
ncbi:AcfA family outer membrane beta-barrel protein [Vibrio sp. 10N.247.311.51]|uniref:AcfA family outer membrane beta-barrel protein n=1 Tax=Vibrio sp. 10N.247.311.51 TaxID=3229996 RepID=UPI003553645E